MELAAIVFWLASAQPFAPGVALYTQLGASATYQRLFALGETEYSRQVLARELRALVSGLDFEVTTVAVPEPKVAPAMLTDRQEYRPADFTTSPHLLAVRQQLRIVRDERSHTHAQLTAKNLGKKARFDLASRILELTDQEVKLKETEAHVLEHGRLPGPVATAEVTDAGVLRQRLTNLLSLRSKLRQKPARADDLARAEAEIILIRSKLNP